MAEGPINQNCSLKTNLKECTANRRELNSLSTEDQKLILIRSGLIIPDESIPDLVICDAHYESLFTKFTFYEKFCSDPNKAHNKRVTSGLAVISNDFYLEVKKSLQINLVPGKKICSNCKAVLNRELAEKKEALKNMNIEVQSSDNSEVDTEETISKKQQSEEGTPTDTELTEDSQKSSGTMFSTPTEVSVDVIDNILENLRLSPFKVKDYHEKQKVQYIRDKANEIKSACVRRLKKIASISETVDIESELIEKNAENFMELMTQLKETFKDASYSLKLQILTLVPDSWSRAKTVEFFEAPDSMVKKARELKFNKGILATPELRTGRKLSADVLSHIEEFFSDEKYVRFLPGKRDSITNKDGKVFQKRFLLANLDELYRCYKKEYPGDKIGFSKFCSLRPKYCLLAGASGTHSICVCSSHENIKLVVNAADSNLDYKDVVKKIVCDDNSRLCMLRLCSECCDIEKIKKVVKESFFGPAEIEDSQDEIIFQQWTQTDRAELIMKSCSKTEFIDMTSMMFVNFIPHLYVAKMQSSYLKERKNNITNSSAIVLLDFSENYSYVLQNEIQSYYWARKSCTVHPVVIYLKIDEKTKPISLCFLTEDLKHDVATVSLIQEKVVEYLKENYPQIVSIEYFSDGCAGQYKNCTNILNLCEHEKKFGMKATWTFFATSHGKSACDAIGGVLKCHAGRESLRRSPENRIDNVTELHQFCERNLPSIKTFIIQPEAINEARQKSIKKARTIPGTRGYHQFDPVSDQVVKCKFTSTDSDYSLTFNLLTDDVSTWMPNIFVSFVFDANWQIGFIKTTDDEQLDAQISVLISKKGKSYEWPNIPVILDVPYTNILCSVDVTEKNGLVEVKLMDTKRKWKTYQEKIKS